MENQKLQEAKITQNLKINTQTLLQLEKQDIIKLKNIVLELKNKHLQILGQTYEFRQSSESKQNL
ncbi:hypothetical protein [uncultured Helicobacter sp.]|uniref:hypothetical protein n=1 Tax=uncultured Helicobacter sp. TaxID=175537 RepID=UPI001C39CF2C|nr:hypothetical protein [Candidatus Helicobacter avicola]